MDLDRCPRCGGDWDGGDSCPRCKFVPIGAGLSKTPQKKKKRHRKYSDPTSSRGPLTIVLLALLGFGAYLYKPWQDDWEMVRGWFGHARHHSLVGDWEVVKTIAVTKEAGVMARDSVQKGSFTFLPNGTVTLDLVHAESETTVTGSYLVDGTLMSLRGLKGTDDVADKIPDGLNLSLTWTGNDDVIAMDKVEAIYLHRLKSKGALAGFVQVNMKPGTEAAELKGTMGEVTRPGAEGDAN